MPNYNNLMLIELCRRLVPGDPTLAEEVALSISSPGEYCARFEERLDEDRGIRADDLPIAELPWIAILDGLYYRKKLDELDWRASPADVASAIDTLLPPDYGERGGWDWICEESWSKVGLDRLLQAVGDRLIDDGLILAQMSENSDSYPIIIITAQDLPQLQELARQAGYGTIWPISSLRQNTAE